MDAGAVAIAGVAWAPHTGIRRVEVRIDRGEWLAARLAPAISDDTWVQWVYDWNATGGSHTIDVRAVDVDGGIQSGNSVPVAPDGAEGWHTVVVSVA